MQCVNVICTSFMQCENIICTFSTHCLRIICTSFYLSLMQCARIVCTLFCMFLVRCMSYCTMLMRFANDVCILLILCAKAFACCLHVVLHIINTICEHHLCVWMQCANVVCTLFARSLHFIGTSFTHRLHVVCTLFACRLHVVCTSIARCLSYERTSRRLHDAFLVVMLCGQTVWTANVCRIRRKRLRKLPLIRPRWKSGMSQRSFKAIIASKWSYPEIFFSFIECQILV